MAFPNGKNGAGQFCSRSEKERASSEPDFGNCSISERFRPFSLEQFQPLLIARKYGLVCQRQEQTKFSLYNPCRNLLRFGATFSDLEQLSGSSASMNMELADRIGRATSLFWYLSLSVLNYETFKCNR